MLSMGPAHDSISTMLLIFWRNFARTTYKIKKIDIYHRIGVFCHTRHRVSAMSITLSL